MSTRVAQVIWDLAMDKADRIADGKTKPGRPSDPDLVPRDAILREFSARWFEGRTSAAIKEKVRRGVYRLEQTRVVVREGGRARGNRLPAADVRIVNWDLLEAVANAELMAWEQPGEVVLRPIRSEQERKAQP